MILLPHGRPQAQPPLDHCARAGWESGRVKECVLEMRGVGTPVIIYRITYDDGEEVPCTQPPHRALTHARTQVAEDLRTLPVRRVREEEEPEEDVQCDQQWRSMLRSV